MKPALQMFVESDVPILLIGGHALHAHGYLRDSDDFHCAIAGGSEAAFRDTLLEAGWGMVFRTRFFAKFRPLDQGTPNIEAMFVEQATFDLLWKEGMNSTFGAMTLRVPSLLHVIAMKLQVIKNEGRREAEELDEIQGLLWSNEGAWTREALADVCTRFGPTGIFPRLIKGLG